MKNWNKGIWEHLRDSRLDLVLLDLYLDGFKGWEFLRGVKIKDPELPVIIFFMP